MIIRIHIPMLPIARNTRNIEVVPTSAPLAVNLRKFPDQKRRYGGRFLAALGMTALSVYNEGEKEAAQPPPFPPSFYPQVRGHSERSEESAAIARNHKGNDGHNGRQVHSPQHKGFSEQNKV